MEKDSKNCLAAHALAAMKANCAMIIDAATRSAERAVNVRWVGYVTDELIHSQEVQELVKEVIADVPLLQNIRNVKSIWRDRLMSECSDGAFQLADISGNSHIAIVLHAVVNHIRVNIFNIREPQYVPRPGKQTRIPLHFGRKPTIMVRLPPSPPSEEKSALDHPHLYTPIEDYGEEDMMFSPYSE